MSMSMSKLGLVIALGVLGCSSPGDDHGSPGGRGGESGEGGGVGTIGGTAANGAGAADAGRGGPGGANAEGGSSHSATGTSSDGGADTSSEGGLGTGGLGTGGGSGANLGGTSGTGTGGTGGTGGACGAGTGGAGAGNEGGSGGAPPPVPCAQLSCDSPPAPTCTDDSTLTSYAADGTCANGICSYAGTDTDCTFGCAAGACKPDPCTAVKCDAPAAPSCRSTNELVTYDAVGSCNNGACTYSSHSIACSCEGGACSVDPCASVTCDSPPTPTCKDAWTLTSYAPLGNCGGGACNYAATNSSCTFGCENGACSGDPCAAVTCNRPPAPTCKDSSTKVSYPASGSCADSHCSYAPTETACGSNKRCAGAGVCSVCKTASSCGPTCSSCPSSAPICQDLGSTSKCVECLVDADCKDPSAACDQLTQVCKPGTYVPKCGDGLRLPSVPWPDVGSKPYAVAAADFDGDGTVDLASVNYDSADLTILFGNGDGTYGAAHTVSGTYQSRAIEAADLDGDDRPELLVMNEDYKRLYVYANDGTGNFLPATSYQLQALDPPQSDAPTQVKAADFNGDGSNDVVVISAGVVKVLAGKGDGTLGTPVIYPAGPSAPNGTGVTADNIVVADLNGDKVLDLLTTNTANARLGILIGNGNGTFQDAYQIRGYTDPHATAVADFDRDGNVDIAIADWNDRVKLLRGNGKGRFELAGTIDSPGNPADVVSADFNGDGFADLAVSHATTGSLRIFFGNGDGTFQPDMDYQGVGDPYTDLTLPRLITTDLNEDGLSDVVMAVSSRNDLGIFLGRKAKAPKGPKLLPVGSKSDFAFEPAGVTSVDLNGDGRMDLVTTNSYARNESFSEVSVLLAAPDGGFRPSVEYQVPGSVGTVVAADFNQDNKPDVAFAVDGGIQILLGDGHGGLIDQQLGAYGPGGAGTLAVADLNGDSKPDLITAAQHSYVFLGNGDGTFQTIEGGGSGLALQLAFADFDHDGKLDLAQAGYQPLTVEFGKGDGTFEGQTSFDSKGDAIGVVAADFNGDGHADLVTVANGFVVVRFGTGTRTFGPPAQYPVSGAGLTMRAADLDGDSKLDLVLGDGLFGGGPTLGVLLNNGNGTFGAERNYAASNVSQLALIVGDFNGDGRTDLATTTSYNTADRQTGAVSVLINDDCGAAEASGDAKWDNASNGGTPYQSVGAGWAGSAYVPSEPSTLQIPGVIFVREDGPADGDGTSWAKAMPSLETALQAAAYGAGDQIWVGRGYYVPGTQQFDAAFGLVSGVAVYGGFDGFQASKLSDRDPARYETILDGDRIGDDDTNVATGDDASYVVYASNVGPTGLLDGFIVQNGANHNEGKQRSNIFVEGDLPTLRNLKIRWSHQDSGGGMTIEGTSTTPATWENLVFEDNQASAMTIEAGVDLTCRHCSFKNNIGGISVVGDLGGPATLKLVDSDFQDAAPPGGASELAARGPVDLTAVRCVFRGTAETLIGNLLDATLHVIDSVAVGRTAPYGSYPAAFALSTTNANALTSLDIVNSTFVGNGGEEDRLIQTWEGGPIRIRVYNSVLSDPGPALEPRSSNVTLETSHSVIDDSNGPIAGPGNISGNLLLDVNGRPLAGSPLINAGTSAVPDNLLKDLLDLDRDGDTTELLAQDFDGFPRIVGTIDIGAFESKP